MTISLNGVTATQEQIDALGLELSAAKAVGALAAQVGSAASISAKVGTVAVRFFGGRVFRTYGIPATTNGSTFEVAMTTATHFDAVRIIYALGNLAPTPNSITPTIQASVAVLPDLTDASLAAASWNINVTFNGTAAGNYMDGTKPVLFAPSVNTNRRGYLVSDIIPISSVPRTDGGQYPILVTRANLYTPDGSGGNIVISGVPGLDITNWATHPSGRIWRQRLQTGSWLNTGMSSATATLGGGSPIAGVIYYARGKVVNVAGFGDSITEAVGATYRGAGFGFDAALELSAESVAAGGPAYEWSDFGWEGQNMSAILQNMSDALALNLPLNIGIFPNGSPNDIINGTGGVASISGSTLTVTTATTLPLAVGQYIYLPSVAAGTYITALGTGSGGTGTYTINLSQTVASGTLYNTQNVTSSAVNTMRWKTQLMYNKLVAANIAPVLWSWMPTNNRQKTYGATDSVRVSYNNDWRAMAGLGLVLADFDAALSGITDASGQVQFLAGTTTDDIHPNDTGNTNLKPVLKSAIRRAFYNGSGAVVRA